VMLNNAVVDNFAFIVFLLLCSAGDSGELPSAWLICL
jgi:hypothetical protein